LTSLPLAPRLAVVVTAHNYGHFLSACLDSALDQTRPVDELVVIDDGSVDATPEVLEAYADRARIIRTPNGGQAAAFNRGLRETTAELVLFLDADDVLLPHAAETIRLHWSSDLSHMVFGLEIIDAGGASLGTHPGLRTPPAADNRPVLLRTGTFAFPPTSGNVFSRRMLESAMPMPEDRWRISADCYLIRAAALFGRTSYVPRVLGGYRMHFGNNYARLGPGGWDRGLQLSNRRDIADAMDDLSRAPEALLGPGAPALRGMLRRRATAIRTGDPGDDADFAADESALLTCRYLPVLELDTDYDLTRSAEVASGSVASGNSVEIDLRLPLATGPLSIELDLDPEEFGAIHVAADDTPATRLAPGETRATLSIARRPFEADPRVHIAVTADAAAPPRLLRVRVTAGGDTLSAPMIPEGPLQLAYTCLGTGMDRAAWRATPEGAVELTREVGRLRFSAPGAGHAILTLDLGAAPPDGWLSIDADETPAFRGWTGNAARLDLPLLVPPSGEVDLAVLFSPEDTNARFRIEAVKLVLEDPPEPGRLPFVPISVGEQVAFTSYPYSGAILREGWSFDGTAAEITSMEAGLAFRVPLGAVELVVTLSLARLFPVPEGRRVVLGVSRDGELIGSAQLIGDGDLELPLGDAPPNGIVELTLHAVETGKVETGKVEPRLAALELVSMRLDGRLAATDRRRVAPIRRVPPFRRFLDEADRLLAVEATPDSLEALARCRAALCGIIAGADVALALLLAGQDAHLSDLVRLAEATRSRDATEAERRHFEATAAEASERGRTAHALLGVLLLPAYCHPFGGDLEQLPVPLRSRPGAIAAYLGAAPELTTAAAHGAYRSYLLRLLESIHRGLEPGPGTGRLYRIAAETLKHLRAVRTIFADGNLRDLVRLQSGAIERVLTDGGAPLAMPRTLRPGLSRLRIGVLVRDLGQTPESWAVMGMYAGLDPARFDPVLIRVADDGGPAPGCFAETLSLAGMTVPQSVRAIRALDLDLFVTGAYARDHERVSAIYAHRLAPLQIWHAAVCPTTGGFGSFDAALSCRATEPENAQEHYIEPLAWIEGPKQCAYAFGTTAPPDVSALREELGVRDGEVLMISAAMAHKLDDDLLVTWARILAEAPDAKLALAPFAPNWSMGHDPARIEARLLAAGMPGDLVILLPPMPPSRLHDLLAAADLMLDSFPYTGATTVCEALAAGTPVVTLAGQALRQLTGASWVRAYGLPDLVAESVEEYVRIATRLATDRAALSEARARTAEAAALDPPPHDDSSAFGNAFSHALWRLAETSGVFPGLGPAAGQPFVPSHTPDSAPSRLKRADARTLAILASPRTGSTLLCAVLNRTPGVICHFELFHDEMIQFARHTVTDVAEIASRNADPVGFLRRVRAEAAEAGMDLVAFKHFAHLDDTVTDEIVRNDAIRLIHLSRENLLAQYSSEKIARASGKWVRHRDQTGDQVRVPFEAKDFEKFEAYYRRIETERVHRLAGSRRTVLFVEYADLNTPETRRRIGDFIGIAIPDTAQPDTRKQNPPQVIERFSNPEVVRDYLARRNLSRWAEER
jgi:glycosyltransferase involved in cell wall biosynthesis